MVTEGADSLSLAAVCCVLPKGRAKKAATPCTGGAVLYWSSLLGTFWGVRSGKRGPSQPESAQADVGHPAWMRPTREACAWLTVKLE